MRTFTKIAWIACSALLLTVSSFTYAQSEKEKEEKGLSKYERANAEYLLIEAQKFFLLEDYERALAFLDQSLKVDANNHAAYFKRAETFLVTEKYDLGIESIQKAQELLPNNKYYYILAAQLYKAQKDLDSAAGEYEKMLANTNDYREYLLDLVDIYVELEKYDKALTTLESTEKAFNAPDKFMLQKKEMLVLTGRVAEAEDYLKTLLVKDQNNLELLSEYIGIFISQDRMNEAIAYLEGVGPEVYYGRLLLFKLYAYNSYFEKAAPLWTQILEIEQFGLDQYVELGFVVAKQTTDERAPLLQTIAEYLVEKAPDDPRVLEIQKQWLQLQAASGSSGNNGNNSGTLSTQTYEILVKLKESDPASFENWKKLLDFQYKNRYWEGLAEDAMASLDYFPNQGLFYYYSGSGSLYIKELDDAADLLKQSLRLSASNDSLKARTLGKLGELSFAQGDNVQAKKHFNEALTIIRLPEIINNYSLELALRQLDMDKAMELATEAGSMQPDQLRNVSTQAFIHFQAGTYGQAKALLEGGISRLPQQVDGHTLELYGDVLMKLNLVDQAIAEWQKAKKLGRTSEKLDQKIANKEYF